MTKRKLQWTANQLKFQEWLATPKYQRTPPTQLDVADVIGVTNVTLSRWKALDGFEDAVIDMARAAMRGRLPDVYGALVREADKGSFQHIKLIMEMTGQYLPTMDVTSGGERIKGYAIFKPDDWDTDTDDADA